jgi:hypothetical protein
MRGRHRPRVCGSCQAPIARADDACWRCAMPRADDEPRPTPSTRRPRHGARQHQLRVDAGIVGRHAHAAAVRRRPVAATTGDLDLTRAAGTAPSVPRRPAPGLVSVGSSGPTPLLTRHTRGVIEAERDRRRQRRAHGGIAHAGTPRQPAASAPLGRIATAVAGNARAVAQARVDLDRWVHEGGLVPLRGRRPAPRHDQQEMNRCSS